MTLFEDFVNAELPRRPVMLTLANTGYSGDPNSSVAPIINNAPVGSFFINDADDTLWKKNDSGSTTWAQIAGGLHAATHAEGQADELNVTTLAGYPGTSTTVLRGDATFGLPVGTGGGGGLGETAVTDVRLSEFVIEGYELSASTTLEVIGTLFVAAGGTAEVRLYDLGAPGSPTAPVLRSTLTFLNANANVANFLTQALTAVASPAAPNNNEIHNVSHLYEIRMILDPGDAGADGDALHITKVRFV